MLRGGTTGALADHHCLSGGRCFASKAKKVVEMRVLRTTQEDVYDLCWSPSSHEIVSASVDHKVFVWNAVTGKHITFFDDHSNYVQGVCWDPREKVGGGRGDCGRRCISGSVRSDCSMGSC